MTELLANEYLVLGCIFAAVVLAVIGVAGALQPDRASHRFKGRMGTGQADDGRVSLVYQEKRSAFLTLIEPFQKAIAQSDPAQVSAARKRLIEAGYYRPRALEPYFTLRVVIGILLPVAAALFLYFASPGIRGLQGIFVVVLAAAVGYYFPPFMITSRIGERRKAFRLGLPDALDMLLVGVEAGLSLPAALEHVVKQFADTHPLVSEQFQVVLLEFRAGKSRADALHRLSTRMNMPETRTLASMVVQAESLGTSMAQTLRVMADELRIKRMLEAEKKASELPVKMAVPLVCLIFPSLMAVALVPALLAVFSVFGNL